jgi:thioredoxin 1
MKILKFHALWCSPCKILSNELKDFNLLPIEDINIEEEKNKELVNTHAVRGLPTIVIVDDQDEPVFKRMGVMTKSQLEDIVKNLK